MSVDLLALAPIAIFLLAVVFVMTPAPQRWRALMKRLKRRRLPSTT